MKRQGCIIMERGIWIPKYSMLISTDPALGEYIPKAPINEEAKRYNQNLPGMVGCSIRST